MDTGTNLKLFYHNLSAAQMLDAMIVLVWNSLVQDSNTVSNAFRDHNAPKTNGIRQFNSNFDTTTLWIGFQSFVRREQLQCRCAIRKTFAYSNRTIDCKWIQNDGVKCTYVVRIPKPMREGTQRMQKLNIIFQLKFLRIECVGRARRESREAKNETINLQHMRTSQWHRNRVDACAFMIRI